MACEVNISVTYFYVGRSYFVNNCSGQGQTTENLSIWLVAPIRLVDVGG